MKRLATTRCAALAAIAAAIVACGGANMMPREDRMNAVPTAVGPPPPLDDDPSAKVDKLYADVVARQKALKLPAPPHSPVESCDPTCELVQPPEKPSQSPECSVGSGAACVDACVQADAACDDAAKICAIAKDLRTDVVAAGRCRDASATCTAAHPVCCGCKP